MYLACFIILQNQSSITLIQKTYSQSISCFILEYMQKNCMENTEHNCTLSGKKMQKDVTEIALWIWKLYIWVFSSFLNLRQKKFHPRRIVKEDNSYWKGNKNVHLYFLLYLARGIPPPPDLYFGWRCTWML